MNSFVPCERIIIPAISFPIDGRSVFRQKESQGELHRWESFRLDVESSFGPMKSAPSSIIQRWELSCHLSTQDVLKEFPGTYPTVRWWGLMRLLFPYDLQGNRTPSIFRKLGTGVVPMHVPSGGSASLFLVDVTASHGGSSRASLHVKVSDDRSFNSGRSFFSAVDTP